MLGAYSVDTRYNVSSSIVHGESLYEKRREEMKVNIKPEQLC
jgi:hypothetical protein